MFYFAGSWTKSCKRDFYHLFLNIKMRYSFWFFIGYWILIRGRISIWPPFFWINCLQPLLLPQKHNFYTLFTPFIPFFLAISFSGPFIYVKSSLSVYRFLESFFNNLDFKSCFFYFLVQICKKHTYVSTPFFTLVPQS